MNSVECLLWERVQECKNTQFTVETSLGTKIAEGEMLHKGQASVLTGSRGLDLAQVITVETKINTFRFSKWLISSFRAVGPKSEWLFGSM